MAWFCGAFLVKNLEKFSLETSLISEVKSLPTLAPWNTYSLYNDGNQYTTCSIICLWEVQESGTQGCIDHKEHRRIPGGT
jgi:hypothetical protein